MIQETTLTSHLKLSDLLLHLSPVGQAQDRSDVDYLHRHRVVRHSSYSHLCYIPVIQVG